MAPMGQTGTQLAQPTHIFLSTFIRPLLLTVLKPLAIRLEIK
jgi:hypothetical protein